MDVTWRRMQLHEPLDHSPAARAGWGRVAFAARGRRTAVTSLRSHAPLRLLAPKNHGRAAWVFTASLGGGLVDGDAIDLEARVGEGAWALLGTQASTKVYRSPRHGASQSLRAEVAHGGALVVLSDPVVPFREARYAQRAEIALAPDASLVYLDVVTCGRRAHGELWDFRRYASRTRIRRGEKVTIDDRVVLDPAHGPLAARMRRHQVLASVFVVGPAFEEIARELLDWKPLLGSSALVAGASPTDGGAVARVAGENGEIVSAVLRERFAPLAGLLGDDPFARKW
jgi:urease accessory protein